MDRNAYTTGPQVSAYFCKRTAPHPLRDVSEEILIVVFFLQDHKVQGLVIQLIAFSVGSMLTCAHDSIHIVFPSQSNFEVEP